MPGPKAAQVILSEAAKCALNALEKGHKTGQQLAQRARMILLAGSGKANTEIGRERWVALDPIPLAELSVAERLEDLPRPGAPPKITADQRCQMEALACEAPEQYGRPINQWTGREIADELMARKIVETISARHAQRLLKRIIDSPAHEPVLAEQ